MKKIFSFVLILALALVVLVGCGDGDKPVEAYVNGTHLSEYTLVYSADELDYNKRAAEYIQREVKERTNIELNLITDAETAAEHEIVVGQTNRPISKKLDGECEGLEFAILADGGCVALEGDYFIVAAAAYYFINTYVPGGDSDTAVPTEVTVCEPIVKEAKNYIVMIGDGMGVNQTLMFDYIDNNVEFGDGEDMFYGYMFPYIAYSRTESLSGVTDSAAGGTALATGYKTYNDYVGKNKDGEDVMSLTELAATFGKATAVMSTETQTGATPSTFSAHVNSREQDDEIRKSQLATMQNYGTLIECGFDYYNKRMVDVTEGDVYEVLDKMSADPDGFFLMYEEAHIDKHCHSNDMSKTFQAVVRFNQIIARMMEYAFYNPETMVIITADHETGDLRPTESGELAYNTMEHTVQNVPVFAYGKGAELFDGVTLENIQIAHTIASFMGVTDFGDQTEFTYLGKQ